MAPRKAAKHSDTDIVDKAAEAGDVSPPKRKKTTAKSVNKSEEEKQIRLPRAAKSTKIEQFEAIDTNSTATKNTKTKAKRSSVIKNVSIPVKVNSKVKTGKKNKESDEKGDMSSGNTETGKLAEEIETKKSRTKAATKKAGIDADEESKGKVRGKTKKGVASEAAESLEAPAAKKRKPINTEVVSKENKPKARTAKKKNEVDTDTKHKAVSNKTKTAVNSESETNSKADESTITAKVQKKANEEKTVKPAVARKTRGRKNEASPEGKSKDDELKAVDEGIEPAHASDTESQEDQNNQTESTESTQSPKRAKNAKKKELITLQKKAVKTRGKAANRNADIASNEDEAETLKVEKDVQKKASKESMTAAPAKKSRARKGAVAATVKDENGEKIAENVTEDKKILSSPEMLNANNDNQKLLQEDNGKDLDSEKEDTKYTKSLGMLKRTEDIVAFKGEVNESNDLSTSVQKEEEN